MKVEIISTGDEVLTGFITDTNVSWLCQELLSLGIQPTLRHTVGDNLSDIENLLKERSRHCDLLLVNGGLGPTSDDNTTQAAAQAAGVKQVLNEYWYKRLEEWHQKRGRIMPKTNIKQAMLPEGAVMIDNQNGTACGFYLKINNAVCMFTPGVPSEFKSMYLNGIKPYLLEHFAKHQITKVKRLFLFGISESLLGQLVEKEHFADSIVIGYRAAYPLLELKVIETNATIEEESYAINTLRKIVKNYLICEDDFNLASRIALLLNNEKCAIFDNVTAGLFSLELYENVPIVCSLSSTLPLSSTLKAELAQTGARYLISLERQSDDSVVFTLSDFAAQKENKIRYKLGVTLKDKKKAAYSLTAQAWLYHLLENIDPLLPDNSERSFIK